MKVDLLYERPLGANFHRFGLARDRLLVWNQNGAWLWHAATAEVICPLEGLGIGMPSQSVLAFFDDGARIAGGFDEGIRIWSSDDGRELDRIAGIGNLRFVAPHGTRALSWRGNELLSTDLSSREVRSIYTMGGMEQLGIHHLSPDGASVISSYIEIHGTDHYGFSPVDGFHPYAESLGDMPYDVAWLGPRSFIASYFLAETTLHTIDEKTNHVSRKLGLRDELGGALAAPENGSVLACFPEMSAWKLVRIDEPSERVEIAPMSRDPVTATAFAESGRALFALTRAHVLRAWNVDLR